MRKFTIYIPAHMQQHNHLATLPFDREQDAIEIPAQAFTRHYMVFKLKQTKNSEGFYHLSEKKPANVTWRFIVVLILGLNVFPLIIKYRCKKLMSPRYTKSSHKSLPAILNSGYKFIFVFLANSGSRQNAPARRNNLRIMITVAQIIMAAISFNALNTTE
jgi:hypothetical protein